MQKSLYFLCEAMLPWLTQLGPNGTVLLLTFGMLLIYLELNRPGWILPGCIGVLIFLLAVAAMQRAHPHPLAIALLASGFVLLLLGLLRSLAAATDSLAAAAFVMAFLHVGALPAVAIVCGLVLGAGTYFLTRIARRARTNKGLDLDRARPSRPGVSKF